MAPTARAPLTIVTNVAAPYRDGLFQELQRLFDAKVYLLADDEPRRRWRRTTLPYNAAHVPAIQLPGRQRPWYCPFPTWLARRGYIVVAGFGLQTILTALVRPRSTLLWSEATHVTEQTRGNLRILSRRWLIRRCRAGVAVGQASTSYLRDLGARAVLLLPNVIDTPPIREADETNATDLEGSVVLAHVGDWSIAKGADDVTLVFQMLRERLQGRGRRVELIIAGNVLDAPIPDGAKYLGYLPHAAVWNTLRAHRACFLLLLSKADTWGFVVPEAVAAGLIPVASTAVGSAPDLLAPIESCLVVESAQDAVTSIARLLSSPRLTQSTLAALQAAAGGRTAVWAARHFAQDLAALETSWAPQDTRSCPL